MKICNTVSSKHSALRNINFYNPRWSIQHFVKEWRINCIAVVHVSPTLPCECTKQFKCNGFATFCPNCINKISKQKSRVPKCGKIDWNSSHFSIKSLVSHCTRILTFLHGTVVGYIHPFENTHARIKSCEMQASTRWYFQYLRKLSITTTMNISSTIQIGQLYTLLLVYCSIIGLWCIFLPYAAVPNSWQHNTQLI